MDKGITYKTALENMPKEKDHRIWTDLTFTF